MLTDFAAQMEKIILYRLHKSVSAARGSFLEHRSLGLDFKWSGFVPIGVGCTAMFCSIPDTDTGKIKPPAEGG